jgi:hypothetical protein
MLGLRRSRPALPEAQEGASSGHRFWRPKVVHGLPTPEAMRDAQDGKPILGGCDPMIPPEIVCPTCGEIVDRASGAPPGVTDGVPEGTARQPI